MQAADAAHVWLDEAQRVLPHGADEIDDRIIPAEHGVVLALGRRPALAQPCFLFRRDPERLANSLILEVEVGQTLERVLDGERDVMDICNLIGEYGKRAG